MKSRFAGLVAAVGLTIVASANAYAATIVVNSQDDLCRRREFVGGGSRRNRPGRYRREWRLNADLWR
jgi:hypothetical protein